MNLSIGESDFLLDSTNSSQEESEGQIDSEEELNQLSAYRTWNVSSNKDPLKLTLSKGYMSFKNIHNSLIFMLT